MLDAADIRRRFPMFAPADDEIGLYETAQRVRPARADGAASTYAAPAAAGADLRFEERAPAGRPTTPGCG